MAVRVCHQDIVRQLLDAKAVDFDAIGRTIAEIGPAISLADEPWEDFCGTMRGFIRVYRLTPNVSGGILENLSALRNVSEELQR